MNEDNLSVWIYLNEAKISVEDEEFDRQRVARLIGSAYRILTGVQVGDFEEGFLDEHDN